KPSPNGYLYHEAEELAALITTAHKLGLSTATHAQGPLPIGVVLDSVEAARAERPRTGLVHRIEHCGFPTSEQIGRMAALNVVPVPQPMQVNLYADSLMDEFGEFGSRFYPYGEFEAAGVPVVISSDAPVTMPNPLEAVWAATTRETIGGGVSGPESLRASREKALAGVTSTPAALLGRSDIGALRVGAKADLVFLDADPVTVALEKLPAVGVTESWIGGVKVG
ncbi:MAG: amidohydrolase family protein, partial [Marmoricola sp.]